jgi:hypothetical protein
MSGARQVSGKQPADVGVRDALLLRKVGDLLRTPALNPPPPVRADERRVQGLVWARLRGVHSSVWCHDRLSAATAPGTHSS